MRRNELRRRLAAGAIVTLTEESWAELAPELEVVARHDTFVAGELLVVRMPEGRVAVERPEKGRRVLRLLGGAEEAETFVRRRLEAYERMWDGCGCRVDYYDPSG